MPDRDPTVPLSWLPCDTTEAESKIAEMSSWDQANRWENLGLVWRNRKKIIQIINDYLCLPFFRLIILCLIYSLSGLTDISCCPLAQCPRVQSSAVVDTGRRSWHAELGTFVYKKNNSDRIHCTFKIKSWIFLERK
jgi:hypothetical protein